MKPVANYTVETRGVRIPFRLKPYESVFYIFKNSPEPAHVVETNADAVEVAAEGKVICTTADNGTIYIRTGGAAKKAARQEMLVTRSAGPARNHGRMAGDVPSLQIR